jgi:hypothetical protein
MFRPREVIKLALEQFKQEYNNYTYWKRDIISYVIYSQLCLSFSTFKILSIDKR